MAIIHFLNVLEGDCNIIQHDSGRLTVIDVSNAYNATDTDEEKKVKASKERSAMRSRTQVPTGKKDYKRKEHPDNPIDYLANKLAVSNIFRFIITHPDMDHLDGINDLFEEFTITNTWDTNNTKEFDLKNFFAGYNKEDAAFYLNLRDGKYTDTKRLTYYDYSNAAYWNKDDIKILCPTEDLVEQANESTGDYHDLSYVILFTPPKKDGGKLKIIFAGDSHDASWEYILKNYKTEVTDIDILFAPHHGRDSDRDYDFLNTLKPKVTLFGNASAKHLAYTKYPETRITNNQAGFVIFDITQNAISIYVENYEFANDFRNKKGKRDWGVPTWNNVHKAYYLGALNA